MTENERKFAESIVNFEWKVKKAQQYIKETYQIDSQFDIETGNMYLTCAVAENALMLAAAKEYITEEVDESLTCIYGEMPVSEANTEEVVYVLKDENGQIIDIFVTSEDAEKAKKEYEITPDMKAEIEKMNKSEFVKE